MEKSNNSIELMDLFTRRTLGLIDKHPEFEDEIKSSSVIVYSGGIPKANISDDLSDELKNEIKLIFNNLFN